MELHVYSAVSGSPTVDPACLAAVWLAERSAKVASVYASSNPHVSPTGTLPAVVPGTSASGTASSSTGLVEPVAGYPEIAALLESRELEPLEVALVAYCQKLAVLTQWTLFVVNENYEGLTRPDISASIPFPMQYNAALALRHRAEALQSVEKKKGPGTRPSEVSANETEVNRLHAAMLEKNREREKARQAPKDTLRRLVQITALFSNIVPLLEEISDDSPATLLVAANLVLLTLPGLPTAPLAPAIEGNDRLRALRDQGRARNFQLTKVDTVPSEKAYTLWNTVAAYAGR